jgi:large subunit ribosomal protein L25
MAEELNVEIRQLHGKRNNRRLRHAGKIPAVLYGHGLECVSLTVPSEKLEAALRHGGRLVTLTGAVSESAFVRELQWDTYGTHLIHVDLTRISMHEKVEVQVTVELRGEAPGVREGGVIEQLIHQVTIECPAGSIPEKLTVSINHLKLEDTITVAALELPPGSQILGEADAIVVQCVVPTELPEEGAGEAAAGEPEVIGEKKRDEEGEES